MLRNRFFVNICGFEAGDVVDCPFEFFVGFGGGYLGENAGAAGVNITIVSNEKCTYLNVGRCKRSIKCCSNGLRILEKRDGGVEIWGRYLKGLSQFLGLVSTLFMMLVFDLDGVLFFKSMVS